MRLTAGETGDAGLYPRSSLVRHEGFAAYFVVAFLNLRCGSILSYSENFIRILVIGPSRGSRMKRPLRCY